jgi:hypothetical protein
MTEPLTIHSRDPGASLTLRPHDRDYFVAEVRHAGIDASARVGTYLSSGFADFFAGLAADWRGWTGHRRWASLEGELAFTAESDRAGHVYLHVHLHDGAPARWEVEAELVLEAGQLERVAREARTFELAPR